jgi:hypothetical protein
MNKRQAFRVALAVNANYILQGAETACITERISEDDGRRFSEAQEQMALGMLRRAGLPEDARYWQADEILDAIIGPAALASRNGGGDRG